MSTVFPPTPPKLLVGATNAELRRLAVAELPESDLDGLWIVSRQRIAANRLLYELVDDSRACVAGVERGSLYQCALRVALPSLIDTATVPATRLGIEAGVIRALRGLDGSLTELGDLIEARGLPERLAATVGELRAQQVDAEALMESPSTGADLARILERYERALDEAGIGDRVAVYDRAIQRLSAGQACPVRRLLAFEQPLNSAIEQRFVAALAKAGVRCSAVVLAADRTSVERYSSAWGIEPTRRDDAENPDTGLDLLRRRLFSDWTESHEADPDDSVEVLAAPGEEREAVEVARRIHRLARRETGGEPFDAIGIVVRSPDIYQPVLEEAFSRAGVPAFFSRGTLRPDPAGRAFLALLRCRAEGYSATRFAEYLSLGQVPAFATHPGNGTATTWLPSADPSVIATNVDDGTTESQLTLDFDGPAAASGDQTSDDAPPRPNFPRRWERLLVEASVIGGYDRWRQRLEGLEHELEARLEHIEADDPSRAGAVRARLDEVRNLERFALPLIEALATLPDEADIGDWIPALEALARRSLRWPRRVLTLLADLRPMAGVGSMRLSEVRSLLEQRLGELRLEPEGSPYGKVFVGTPEEFRGLSFDSVFLCGLAEGIFPRRVREDPLLLDDARVRLDAGLEVNDTRVAEERLRLQVAAAAAADRLVISYPTWDGLTGRARVPSFYAFDAVDAAWGNTELLGAVSTRSPVDRDPSLAIDAAEFDVATLRPLLSAAEAETGCCHYLVEVNDHLARSLRNRGRRWLNFLSPVDGLVDPQPSSLEALDDFRLTRRSYSPTSLQHYAACPYRFYLHGILRLRPREEIEDLEQLDPLTRGSLYHAIQFSFLRDLAEDNALEFSPQREPDLLQRLDRAIENVAADYSERLRPALPAVYDGEVGAIRTDLRGWLRQVIADDDYTPSHFELSFGLPVDDEHDPASRTDPLLILERLLAKGSIDMVETAGDGVVRVTDHKTGKARDTRSLTVGGGEALQPLVYAYAAAGLLSAEVGAGRLWYSTRRGRYQSLTVPTGKYQRQSLETVLDTIDASVKRGFFPAAPREKACTWCDYRAVCGPHEELRLQIKTRNPETRERLAEITHVRGME